MEETDLLVVGGGAKAAALAAKIHTINRLGLGPISLTIVEKVEWAASWLGRNGMTSGEEPLAIPPIKDVGFPYESGKFFGEAGEEIDSGMLAFSWQQYMMNRGGYARWINAGAPSVQHRDYGRYLGWVLSRATEGVRLVRGRVTEIGPSADGGRWEVAVAETDEAERHSCGSIMLTGPGVHRAFPHDAEIASRLFHCDSRRGEFAQIPAEEASEVAIIGGGESALSCLVFLRSLRPMARLTVYTPTLPLSRGESFLENRIFSNPEGVSWHSLDLQMRRDFVRHCDRGVFDPQTLAKIAGDEQCEFVTGRVMHVGAVDGGKAVRVDYDSADGLLERRFDYAVNCTGFDLLGQLRDFFSPEARAEIEAGSGPLWDGPPPVEIPIGRTLALEGVLPRIYIPGLAGVSQGPGFANLGSLGLMSNRVLMPFLLDEDELETESGAGSRAATVTD